MSSILIISSSPRLGGNSDILCDQFAKGATEAGHSVEKITLADKKIGFFTSAAQSRDKTCDDVRPILEKMRKADVIVLATPVYFFSMCAQLKAVIDRSVVIYQKMRDKRFYYIMTMAEEDKKMFKGTVEALRGFLACYDGSQEVDMIRATGVYAKGAVKKTPFFEAAYAMGKKVK